VALSLTLNEPVDNSVGEILQLLVKSGFFSFLCKRPDILLEKFVLKNNEIKKFRRC
jgi:hypothetical protein